jgi:hypothetical protein
MRFIVMALSLALLASGQAYASCEEAWPADTMKARPDVTCVSLTERLLVSLEGATRGEVTKAMMANGKPAQNETHFNSVADQSSGVLNLTFEGDRVVLVSALVDTSEQGKAGMWFIWNRKYNAHVPCSDLPGSRYAPCE